MKYRKSFVTNSSSSSYICESCGAEVSGWDLSLSEAEMLECVNGHTVCEGCIDSKTLNYVAISRAKLLLYILCKQNIDL